MATDPILTAIQASETTDQLLFELKQLKNAVIGNVARKREVAQNEPLLRHLLSLTIELPKDGPSQPKFDTHPVALEALVIIGALANYDPPTTRRLLRVSAYTYLLEIIRRSQAIPLTELHKGDLLYPALRGLRNLLVSTADMLWGPVLGAGVTKIIVGTGLEDTPRQPSPKGKQVPGAETTWRDDASAALSMLKESDHMDLLMGLLEHNVHGDRQAESQIFLPIYQVLARMSVLPSNRVALVTWTSSDSSTSDDSPFLVQHLLDYINDTCMDYGTSRSARSSNPKVLEAALDLLGSLSQTNTHLDDNSNWPQDHIWKPSPKHDSSSLWRTLEYFWNTGPPPVRVAALRCCVTMIMSPSSRSSLRSETGEARIRLLDAIHKYVQSEGPVVMIPLCLLFATLLIDDEILQDYATDKGCTRFLLIRICDFDPGLDDELTDDESARLSEALLLALAATCFESEKSRQLVAENQLVFPSVSKSLHHPSYGVRAAACQLARALSRTVGILRTSLVDSGVAAAVVQVLMRETRVSQQEKEDLGDRAFTVETVAMATICNLVTDFSPIKKNILFSRCLVIICDLAFHRFVPLSDNALFALKNAAYHATESEKQIIIATLSYHRLRCVLDPSLRLTSRVLGLQLMQNLVADSSPQEIAQIVERFGENHLFSCLLVPAGPTDPDNARAAALWVISNLALGGEKIRHTIVERVEILEALSSALNDDDSVKVPAIRTFRHLIESSAKTHKPRPGMIELMQPYHLRPRLAELLNNASLDVCQGAAGLLEVLERAK